MSRSDQPSGTPPLEKASPAELSELLRLATADADSLNAPGAVLQELLGRLTATIDAPPPAPLPTGTAFPAGRTLRDKGADPRACETLRELLTSPNPRLDALRLVKEVAKRWRSRGTHALPPEAPTAIYYACIAAALVRCGVVISDLDPQTLRNGFDWCLRQAWIDPAVKARIEEARSKLSTPK